jgi:hypothetical protein
VSRLSEAQQQTVLRLAQPIQRRLQGEYFRAVAVAIAALPTPIGDGELYRVAVECQRKLFDAPVLDGTTNDL